MRLAKLIIIGLLMFSGFLGLHALESQDVAYAEPIPNGCPGSSNPTTPPPALCAQIPIGCPGSTLQGPPSNPFDPDDCPFAFSSDDNNSDIDPVGGGDNLDASSLNEPERQDCTGSACINDNYLVIMAKWAINILSAVVGVVAVGVIVMAGIQYSSSAGDPGKTAVAKKRMVNAIIALVTFMFLYIGLQWLIPGGLFGA